MRQSANADDLKYLSPDNVRYEDITSPPFISQVISAIYSIGLFLILVTLEPVVTNEISSPYFASLTDQGMQCIGWWNWYCI